MRRIGLVAFLMGVAAAARAQAPAGGEFQVNAFTTDDQTFGRPVMDGASRFTIAWDRRDGVPGSLNVAAQRFEANGARAGAEFRVNTTTPGSLPALTVRRNDAFAVVWYGPEGGIRAQRYASTGLAQGGEFRVNTYTTTQQYTPAVAPLPGGGFVVAWNFTGVSVPHRILARRYDAHGVALSGDVLLSMPGGGIFENHPDVATASDGSGVAIWKHSDAAQSIVQGRRFDAAGNLAGPMFQVSEGQVAGPAFPSVSMAWEGSFVAVWHGPADGSLDGIRGRRFSAAGTPVGAEFTVNQATANAQILPDVATGPLGDFVVTWSSRASGNYEVIARRFAADGTPRTGDFRVNSYTPGDQVDSSVAADAAGNFVITWTAPQDGSGFGVFAQRFGGLLPSKLNVDTTSSSQSDGNGVLEPGETVDVRPWWRNVNGAAQSFTGTLFAMGGPAGATYTVNDGAADYLTVPDGATFSCSNCYAATVSAPPQRPARHWDAWAREQLAPDTQGQLKFWYFHLGDTYGDVPRSSPFYRFVETLIHNYVTAGCTDAAYCPQAPTTREQMAVFVVVARDRAGDPPPLCTTPVFADVPASSPYCAWIEELARVGVVTGCGGGNFCPAAPVSREQMAVFVLRALDPQLSPPGCTTPAFADVPASSPYCRWIEELVRRGVVTGCGGGNYCPGAAVTREQMAVFLTRVFGLTLYGP